MHCRQHVVQKCTADDKEAAVAYPKSLQVTGIVPRRHHSQNVSDAMHHCCKSSFELVERNHSTNLPSFAHTTLVHTHLQSNKSQALACRRGTHETDPDFSSSNVPQRTEVAECRDDVLEAVAPRV